MAHTIARGRKTVRRASLIALFSHFYGVWRQRQTLGKLDSAALHDIGITRGEAFAESRRAFWDAPTGWRN